MSTRQIVLLVIAVVAAPVLAVAGIAGYLWVSGTPLIDEWACSDGEAPYVYPEGGSGCAREGGELPPGAQWDPFGNRPLSCHDRWGWTEVVDVASSDGPTECVRNGDPVPEGWRPVG